MPVLACQCGEKDTVSYLKCIELILPLLILGHESFLHAKRLFLEIMLSKQLLFNMQYIENVLRVISYEQKIELYI